MVLGLRWGEGRCSWVFMVTLLVWIERLRFFYEVLLGLCDVGFSLGLGCFTEFFLNFLFWFFRFFSFKVFFVEVEVSLEFWGIVLVFEALFRKESLLFLILSFGFNWIYGIRKRGRNVIDVFY